VEALPERPMQCFKCMQKGHIRAACPNNDDHSDKCYRCGVAGHRARECTAPSNCVLCERAGRPANHRIGGPACPIPRGGNKRKEAAIGNRPNATPQTANPQASVRVEEDDKMEIEEVDTPPPL